MGCRAPAGRASRQWVAGLRPQAHDAAGIVPPSRVAISAAEVNNRLLRAPPTVWRSCQALRAGQPVNRSAPTDPAQQRLATSRSAGSCWTPPIWTPPIAPLQRAILLRGSPKACQIPLLSCRRAREEFQTNDPGKVTAYPLRLLGGERTMACCAPQTVAGIRLSLTKWEHNVRSAYERPFRNHILPGSYLSVTVRLRPEA